MMTSLLRCIVQSLTRWLAPAASALLLTSCGGGGSDEPTNEPQNGTPISTTQVVVVVEADASVPSGARALIQTISSSRAEGALGGSISVAKDSRAPAEIVMALTDDSKIVLATSDTSDASRVVLTARTTAVALVRLAIGASLADPPSLNSAITSSTALGALVTAVEAALGSSVPPGADSQVAAAVVDVVNSLPDSALAFSSAGRKSRAALPNPLVQSKPAILIDGGFGYGSIEYGGRNSTALYWNLDAAGTSMDLSPGALVIASSFTGAPHVLILSQTKETREANIADFLQKSFLAVIGLVPAGDAFSSNCAKAVTSKLLKADLLEAALLDQTPNLFQQVMSDIVNSIDVRNVTSLLRTCAVEGGANATLKRLFGSMTFYAVIDKAKKAIKAATAAQSYVQLNKYWGTYEDFGICEDDSGAILFCATTFRLVKPVYLIPGASIKPEYEALYQEQRTGMARGLVYSTIAADVVSVDAATGRVTAIKPGDGSIKVTEPNSGVNANVTIHVVAPILSPNPATVVVDGAVLLQLTHPGGDSIPIETEGASVTWDSGDSSKLQLVLGGVGTAMFKGIAPGEVTVTALMSGPDIPLSAVQARVIVTSTASELVVFPTTAALPAGASLTLRAFRVDSSGNMFPAPSDATWRSDNATVASVNTTGRVTGVTNGTAGVSVSSASSGKSAGSSILVEDSSLYGGPQDLIPSGNPDDLVYVRSASVGGGGTPSGPIRWAGGPPSLDGFALQDIVRPDPNAPGSSYVTAREFWYCRATNKACFNWISGATAPP